MLHRKGPNKNWTDLSLSGQEPTFKKQRRTLMSMRIGVDNLVIDSGMEVQLLNGADVVEGDIIDINCRHTQTFICISIALTVQGKINGP